MKKQLGIILASLIAAISFSVCASAKESYSIPNAATAPTIDGTIGTDEWNGALKVDVSGDKITWVLPQADGMSVGAGSYIALMWDADNLYCAANIIDNTYGTQPASGSALNSGDGIQFCFYSSDTATNGDGTSNMFWDFVPRTGTDDASTAESYEHFNFAATTVLPIKSVVNANGNYTMEWAIPWSSFATAASKGYTAAYTGTAGTALIIDLCVMDHDGNATQALGYTSDEWCVPGSNDVFTLTADQAGIVPVAETAAPVTEVPIESTATAAETAAPVTADFALVASAITLATAAFVVFSKKKYL
jgi:Pyruvate/2-oxoglutarate dehydrogenase complex, dehydrogenase (E1) component, eukaryotic type, alpha subunit